jgi:hypothetical protein
MAEIISGASWEASLTVACQVHVKLNQTESSDIARLLVIASWDFWTNTMVMYTSFPVTRYMRIPIPAVSNREFRAMRRLVIVITGHTVIVHSTQ